MLSGHKSCKLPNKVNKGRVRIDINRSSKTSSIVAEECI
jgi:hypothetical protein